MPLSPRCRLNCIVVRRGGEADRRRERERKRETEREREELQRENKALWSGAGSLCQTIMLATGMEGRESIVWGEKKRQGGERRGGREDVKCEGETRIQEETLQPSAQYLCVCLSVCVSVCV